MLALKADREGLLRHEAGGDIAGVHAAREERADRHIADAVRLDRFVDDAVQLLGIGLEVAVLRLKVHVPVALGVKLAVLPRKEMRGQQLVHAGKEGLLGRAVLEGQIGQKCILIDGALKVRVRQHALDLGGEDEFAVLRRGVIHGLDAEHVARAEQLFFLRVPDDKGEHAAQLLHKRRAAVLLVAVQQHLGVAVRGKGVSRRDQLLAQGLKVVDLAVVDQHKALVLVVHRLRAVRKVDDAQAAEAERHVRIGVCARAVRPAMDNQIGHVLNDLTLIFDFSGKPDDTAHSKIPVFEKVSLTNIVYHKRYERASLRADILRAFCIVRLGISVYSVVVRSKNHHKISRPQVSCSFDRADFCPGEKKDAGNTPVFRGLLTMHGRKDAGQNLVCPYRLWYTISDADNQDARRFFFAGGAKLFSENLQKDLTTGLPIRII